MRIFSDSSIGEGKGVMPLITWKEDYSVNINEIDRHHKRLIELINRLHTGMENEMKKKVLGDVLNELIAYTVYHFATEEKYFKRYNYPEYKGHRKEHEDLTEKAKELKYRLDKGENGVLSVEVMNFLKEWLNHHILQVDQKFGPFLNEKGLK